jgi:hypothetical protein
MYPACHQLRIYHSQVNIVRCIASNKNLLSNFIDVGMFKSNSSRASLNNGKKLYIDVCEITHNLTYTAF